MTKQASSKQSAVLADLKRFGKEFQPLLKAFFDREIAACPPRARDMLERLQEFCLRDGKRLRPYLVYTAYQLGGGQKRDLALAAGLIPELIHNFLLVHDDIMDKSQTRRGGLTMHAAYASQDGGREAAHLGVSLGILAGDLLYHLASRACQNLTTTAEKKLAVWAEMESAVRWTIFGQELDMQLARLQHVSQEDLLTMYQYKTAYYSFEAPLLIGALLAGRQHQDLEALSEYALQCGIAFQITDDLLDGENSTVDGPLADLYIKGAKRALEKLDESYDGSARQRLSELADFIGQRRT